MKFSIKDFFSTWRIIRNFLWIYLFLQKKFLIENLCVLSLRTNGFNWLMTNDISIIEKPANWFKQKINYLVSI